MNQTPKRGGQEPGGNWKKVGGTLSFWFLIVMIMVFLSRAFDSEPTEDRLSYTEYRELIAAENHNIASLTIISDDVAPILKGQRQTIGNEMGEVVNRGFTVLLPPELAPEMARWEDRGIPYNFEERETNWLANLAITILPWIFFFGIWIYLMRRMQGGGNKGVFSFGKSRAKMMSENQVKVTFKDVAGADEAKEELEEVIEFLKDPKKFSRLGGRIPKGALMLGPPGTGKTLLARAVAGEAGVPFFSMSGADFVEMFVGVGASRVRDLFEQGKKSAPCIIFIDEIDAVGRQRGAGLGGGHDEREQTLNQLLVEMDGFESNDGVILIAATNRPDVLDPALMRPGRFDRQIVVDRPDARGREGILKVHVAKVPLADDVNLSTVAKGTPGLSGADLANIVNEAALLAARYSRRKVSMSHFEEARDKVLMGTARKSMVLTEEDKRITAWHEAGHALISLLMPNTDKLHKVTIIPRGRALGLTWQLPEDKKHQTQSSLLAELRVLYAGREAEQLVFNEITTGAVSDIRRASQIAEYMVCDVGMSPKLGLRSYGKKQEEIFIGREIAQHRDFSEATAELIDSEINRILEEARAETARMLADNRDKLDLLAEGLLKHEILDAEEVDRILAGEVFPVKVDEDEQTETDEETAEAEADAVDEDAAERDPEAEGQTE